ncbi:tripartite tricarboxylate transporter substrate binding protein [Microbacteriaceae bacterium K1510]|nr:tripartite tricarboxylate transporter substrate binding protein [Microbacteriaceae bacterium K1510]
MTSKWRNLRSAVLLAAGLLGAAAPAAAQSYPTQQPVRIIVPFSAGSATDILARIVAEKLTEKWKHNVVVENRPGLPGTTAVAKSAPDGYTLMLTSNGHTIAGVVNKNLTFDPVKDFAAVTPVASVPVVMIVPPDSPAKSVKDFIALAKDNPGKLNFASPGPASATFIAAAMFKDAAQIDLVHVPYKGAPEAVTSVVRGDTQLYFTPINVGVELVQAGKVRALAVATAARNPTMKDLPTIGEDALPGFKYDSWFGLLAPAGTPRDIVSKVHGDVAEIIKTDDIKAKFAAQGVEAMSMTPEAFDKTIAEDTAKLASMYQDGIK